MNHSHMPVRHFIAQLDRWKQERQQRNLTPEWLGDFINNVAELFDPFHDVARVGFECRPSEEGWQVGLYLGRTEIVGGPDDGRDELCNFTFDIQGLSRKFDTVEELTLFALPHGNAAEQRNPCAFLTLHGTVNAQRLTVRVFTIPPAEVGVGLRLYTDGRCETV